MFPRRQRVPSADLKGRYGRIMGRSPNFILAVRPNGLDHPRFAVVISTKVAARAVGRHVLKRRIAHILKGALAGGNDLVLTVLPPANTLSAAALRTELNKVL